MTTALNRATSGSRDVRPSMLPFDPADLTAMRVKPADFARMCGVSKQAVSRWIKDGKIGLGPDGKLDPAVASRDLIRNTDPARLRAKVFQHATASLGELRDRVQALEAEIAVRVAEAAAAGEAIRYRLQDEIAERLFALSLRVAQELGDEVAAVVDRLADQIFYPRFSGEANEELADVASSATDEECSHG